MAGWLARLFGRERRDFFGAGLGLGFNVLPPGSVQITPLAAENLSTLAAAVQIIAGAIGTLPACVYRLQDGGRVEVPTHPVSRLIRAPNSRQTWPDFIEWLMASTLLHGNGLVGIEFDGAGRPTELRPVPWPFVSVRMLGTGRLAYDVLAFQGPFGGNGMPRRYLADEVLHLKDRSDDTYLGRSRINRTPDVIENALGVQTHSLEMWRSGVSPSGVLKHPKAMKPDVRERLKTDFDEHRGAGRQRKVLLLEDAMDWQAMGVSPEQAQVLDSRRFSVLEVCRLFGVPPVLLSDIEAMRGTAAATAASTWFGQYTLSPWCKKIESEFSRVLLTDPTLELSLDMAGLMRGSFAERVQASVALVNSGIITPNEARAGEGYDKHPDGDCLRVMPGASVPGSGDVPASLPDANANMMNGIAIPAIGAKPNGHAA
jgi:HK97 family phage portal protein